VDGARLLRLEDEVGAVEPSLAADLIAVDGDPTQDLAPLRDIRLVVQAGRVLRWEP
jgi:imidazolonepropionase-like amidohydrolase